jgi:hypothetical protein
MKSFLLRKSNNEKNNIYFEDEVVWKDALSRSNRHELKADDFK